MESVGGYAYFVSEGTLSADPKFLFFFFLKTFFYTFFEFENVWLSGNFWLLSFKISYLCLPLFYETRTTPSCHPS
ncbi:hypothetical protein, partial [Phocaeicola vulgatus]|uniref:hypothetical protein n=1 Tax=Phocaeicola vulgatus TaxID=821 RepID=UPI001C88C980